MNHTRALVALLLVLFGLMLPTGVSAQGCEFLNPPDVPFWISVEAAGGVSVPLSFSKPLVIKRFAPSFRGGVGMNFYNGIRLLVDYQYQSFSGDQSFYDWVAMHQLQTRGLFPLIQSTYVDWHAGPMLGLNFASKKYFLPRRNDDGVLVRKDGRPLVYDSKGAVVFNRDDLEGLLLLTRVPGFTAGIGTRLAFYPLEAWSIFVDVTGGYTVALLETLALEEGALVISGVAGMEMHF